MLVAKEVISPGIYWYTDEHGKPQKLVASPEFIKHLYQDGNAMVRAGLSIPVPLEHEPSAKPKTKAEMAAQRLLNNTGEVKNYTLLPGHRLYSILDIKDKNVLPKLENGTVKWTSPYITSFMDGNGKTWNNVIAHVALTSRPRITKQEPFPTVAAALSNVQTVEPAKANLDACVSRAGLLVAGEGGLQPAFSAAFSTWAGIKLAEEEGSKVRPLEKKGEEKKEVPPLPEAESTETMLDGQQPHSVVDADGDIDAARVTADLLRALCGIDIPEDVSEDNFFEKLYPAVMAMAKEKGMKMNQEPSPENQPNKGTNDLPPNPVVQEQQPLYMSLEEINAIQDPATRRTAKMAAAILQERLNEAKTKRDARISALAKRLPQSGRDKLLAITNVSLSLSAEGKVIDPADAMLSLMEDTVQNVPEILKQRADETARHINLGHGREEPHPEFGDGMTQERAEAVTAEFLNNTGLRNINPTRPSDAAVTALVEKLLTK